MDEDTKSRCLEPFFTTKGERGTGLGLAMVYGALRRHGGNIEIESAPGLGSTFRLLFPVSLNQVDFPGDPFAVAPAPIRLRLLLVDDDDAFLKSLAEILRDEGHEVVTTNGGKAGIEAYLTAQHTDRPFDAVLTDLGMPEVDGRQVALAVKAAAPATPVFLLTGWGQRVMVEEGLPVAVDRVLNKPPKLHTLREALASVRIIAT